MSQSRKNRACICASAAAALTACTLSEDTHADVIWQDGPSEIEGTHRTVAGEGWDNFPDFTVDFDQDGRSDFYVWQYYGLIRLVGSRHAVFLAPTQVDNPVADVISESFTPTSSTSSSISFTAVTASFDSKRALFTAGTSQTPPPYDGSTTYIYYPEIPEAGPGTQFMGGVFEGPDGEMYVGYLEYSAKQDTRTSSQQDGDGYITIHDSGYAAVPEPASLLALSCLAGPFLCARRRRR